MSDDQYPINSGSEGEEQFYGGKQEEKPEEPEVLTKSAAQRQKKKPIHKRKEKGAKPGKRTPNAKDKEKDLKIMHFAERKASSLIDEMQRCYGKDVELFRRKKLACKKLTYLEELAKELKNVYTSEKFLEQNGLAVFEKWLSKVQIGDGGEGVEPSIALRKGIFEILLALNVRSEHIARAEELQRIIQRNKRSQSKELRDLSEQIIARWSQVNYDEAES